MILSVFPFLPKDFWGSASRRNPCLIRGFPCHFPTRQGKEDQGRDPDTLKTSTRSESTLCSEFATRTVFHY